MLTSDFAEHSPYRQRGSAATFRERIALLRLAIPDLHVCIDDLAAGGDMTWAAISVCGTRSVPEERSVDFNRIDTCRYQDGRIAEYWSETSDLLEQLGITVT